MGVVIYRSFTVNAQPSSFSRIAARTIEPVTGASTWVLGNQICAKYTGSVTRNERIANKKIALSLKFPQNCMTDDE